MLACRDTRLTWLRSRLQRRLSLPRPKSLCFLLDALVALTFVCLLDLSALLTQQTSLFWPLFSCVTDSHRSSTAVRVVEVIPNVLCIILPWRRRRHRAARRPLSKSVSARHSLWHRVQCSPRSCFSPSYSSPYQPGLDLHPRTFSADGH